MTKREEAEQAMRFGVSEALGATRVALLREAINEALEDAENEIRMAALDHSGPENDVFCEGMRAAAAVVAEMKKEA